MWQLIAAAAALGFLKANRDHRNEKGARELAAVTAKYSPWTKMQPKDVKEADYLGSMAQGALGGASMGQNIEMADAYSDNLASDTAMKNAIASNEQAQILNQQRSKNQALYAVAGADGLEANATGPYVTDAELARLYVDDNSPWVIAPPATKK